MEKQIIWAIQTREDDCSHGVWRTYCFYKEYKDADKRILEMVSEFPELDLRMRSWTLH